MSAIFGVYDASGVPVDPDLVVRGRDASWYRGSDAEGALIEGNIGLGHRLLTTRENPGISERQPFTNGRGLRVVADSRLDNRTELRLIFETRGLWMADEGETHSDAPYLVAAYELWGKEAPAHLLGDFAFALWDPSEQLLFCARDPLGVRPFVYSWNGRRIIFGSDSKQLFEDASVSRELNRLFLADFVTQIHSNRIDTPYRAVSRLPGGHRLTVSKNGLEIYRFWAWNADEEPLSARKFRDHAEDFRSIFREAVDCRLRGAGGGRGGSFLSGGLDSSSIASVAAASARNSGDGAPFPVFTMLFPEADPAFQVRGMDGTDESQYALAVIEKHALAPHWVRISDFGPLENADHIFRVQECPHPYPNISYFDAAARSASQAGVRVLLHGSGGDELFFPGYTSLRRDFKRRGLRAFFHDWSEWRRRGASRPHLFYYYFDRLVLPTRMSQMVRWTSYRSLPFWLNDTFSRIHDYRSRLKADFDFDISVHSSSNYGIRVWTESNKVAGHLETFNRLAAGHGIEGALPFLDLRLMRFAAALPRHHKVTQNVTKRVLREALKEELPDKVRSRAKKTEFGPVIQTGIRKYALAVMRETFCSPHPLLHEFADVKRLERLYRICFESAPSHRINPSRSNHVWEMWRLAVTNQWLKRDLSATMSGNIARRMANEPQTEKAEL